MRAWNCLTCVEEQQDKPIRVDGSNICQLCFQHLFELAIEDEAEYPAHWGTTKLDYTLYRDLLGGDLYARYGAKSVEYAIPSLQRVYCKRTDPPRQPEPCLHFVGKRSKLHNKCVRCDACMWYTCMRCMKTFSKDNSCSLTASIPHECEAPPESEVTRAAFAGLTRGKDYQICPNTECERDWALWDGCNHMRCVCKTYFCFICGVETTCDYSHWRAEDRNACPLYGSKEEGYRLPDEEPPFDIPPVERVGYVEGFIRRMRDNIFRHRALAIQAIQERELRWRLNRRPHIVLHGVEGPEWVRDMPEEEQEVAHGREPPDRLMPPMPHRPHRRHMEGAVFHGREFDGLEFDRGLGQRLPPVARGPEDFYRRVPVRQELLEEVRDHIPAAVILDRAPRDLRLEHRLRLFAHDPADFYRHALDVWQHQHHRGRQLD